MNITNYILSKTNKLKEQEEVIKTPPGYKMFNSGGVEVETGEFLYSLVKLSKPSVVLETGTHLGISALYFSLACNENKKGKIYTYEVIPELRNDAISLWDDFEIKQFIHSTLKSSLEADIKEEIDILFLDSEPYLRGLEFEYFWPNVSRDGFILVHDLDKTFGKSCPGFKDRRELYKDFRKKIKYYLDNHLVEVINFKTPRGLVLFQKK